MYSLLKFYFLFHHYLIICFGFTEGSLLFYLMFRDLIFSMLGNFAANESFKIEITSPFCICSMYDFSDIIIKKLLKALDTFVGSLNF